MISILYGIIYMGFYTYVYIYIFFCILYIYILYLGVPCHVATRMRIPADANPNWYLAKDHSSKEQWFSGSMLGPSATHRQLVRKPLFFGMVWGGGDVNVPVNLLTSCMIRELRGLGGVGGMLTSLWTCSRHVWLVNFGVWVGWGAMLTSLNVNLLTSCMLRELWGCLVIHNITQWKSHLDTYICISTCSYIYIYFHYYIHTNVHIFV